jgi:hypothetical protein
MLLGAVAAKRRRTSAKRLSGLDVLNDTTTSSGTRTATANITVVGGANNVLIVTALWDLGAASITTVTATAGGVSMTLVPGSLISNPMGSGYPCAAMFYLMNPAPGATTIAATTNSVSTVAVVLHAEEWCGISASTPLGTVAVAQAGNGGTLVRTITPAAVGNIVISGVAIRGGAASAPNWTPDTNVTAASDVVTGNGGAATDIRAFNGYYTTVGTSSVNACAAISNTPNSVAVLVEFRAL